MPCGMCHICMCGVCVCVCVCEGWGLRIKLEVEIGCSAVGVHVCCVVWVLHGSLFSVGFEVREGH